MNVKNIGIIPEGPYGYHDGKYTYAAGEGQYIESLARKFTFVELCGYQYKKSDDEYSEVSEFNFQEPNIEFSRLPLFADKKTGILRKIWQLVLVTVVLMKRIPKWDLVYSFLPGYPGIISIFICIVLRKPYILYLASEWGEESEVLFKWTGIRKTLFLRIFHIFNSQSEKIAVKKASAIFTAGRSTLEKYRVINPDIHETVPRINWESLKLLKNNIRHNPKTHTHKDHINILYVGALIKRKGVNYLLDAVALLKQNTNINFNLVLVGSGSEEKNLSEQAHSSGITDLVEFKGYVRNGNELFNLYLKSDIFVLPTPQGEGFPRVLYEAMISRVPTVATEVSGIPYLLKNEVDSILVKPQSSEAIYIALRQLGEDNELRERLANNATHISDRLFSNSDAGYQVYTVVSNLK